MPATGRNLTVQQMWDHILLLCRTFDIAFIPVEKHEQSRGGLIHGTKASRRAPGVPVQQRVIFARMIECKPVEDGFTYAIALHEIGHIQHPNGIMLDAQNGLDQEHAAWEWAYHHALDWTVEMEAAKDYGMHTHELKGQQEIQHTQRTEVEERHRSAQRIEQARIFARKLRL